MGLQARYSVGLQVQVVLAEVCSVIIILLSCLLFSDIFRNLHENYQCGNFL